MIFTRALLLSPQLLLHVARTAARSCPPLLLLSLPTPSAKTSFHTPCSPPAGPNACRTQPVAAAAGALCLACRRRHTTQHPQRTQQPALPTSCLHVPAHCRCVTPQPAPPDAAQAGRRCCRHVVDAAAPAGPGGRGLSARQRTHTVYRVALAHILLRPPRTQTASRLSRTASTPSGLQHIRDHTHSHVYATGVGAEEAEGGKGPSRACPGPAPLLRATQDTASSWVAITCQQAPGDGQMASPAPTSALGSPAASAAPSQAPADPRALPLKLLDRPLAAAASAACRRRACRRWPTLLHSPSASNPTGGRAA